MKLVEAKEELVRSLRNFTSCVSQLDGVCFDFQSSAFL